jgi:uncharacterized membrane protein YhaH (DUF805 family)
MTLQQLFTSFDGRINRQTFWIAFAMFFAVGIVVYIIALAISIVLVYLVALALIYPQVAVGAKRFHDMGKSGWLQLIGLIPFVGGIILLIWLGAIAGDPGDNAYGSPQSLPLEFKWA